ncbi:dITP/XTP pyrophosphatase [compost metagenome]
MTQQVVFATGNKRKIHECRKVLDRYNIDVDTISVDVDEIQHHDPAEITKAKARAAYGVANRPVVVQDTSWSIPSLGGFPGGYMKDTADWWQGQDWINIMAPYANRKIICLEHVAYFDGENLHHFQASYECTFVDSPRGDATKNNSLELVVGKTASETFAEAHDRGMPGSDDSEHWRIFAEWFSAQ